MKKKSLGKNYLYHLSYQIFSMIIPLITTPYLARVLGAELIGVYSYTISITTYFILFGSLGIAMYGQREIAYVQNNLEKRSIVFWEILFMRFATLGTSLILFYFLFCIQGEYNLYFKILILEIIASSLDVSWFFQGLEEFKKNTFRNIFVKLTGLILIFTCVKSKNDLSMYFFIYALSNLFGNGLLVLYLSRYIKKIKFRSLQIFRHFKSCLLLFIPQIAMQIYTVLDKTMLGFFILNKAEVGFYEQAQKIVKLLLTIATSYGTIMIPRMANTYANKEFEKLKDYMQKSFHFILMLSLPLMFGIIAIVEHFVPFFFGEGYEKVKILIIVMSPIILAISISNVIGTQYLLPTRQQKKFTISVLLGAVTNFALNLILINLWESMGAAIATIIAEFVVTAVQIYLVKEQISFKKIMQISYKYFLASIFMFFVCLFVGHIISNHLLAIFFQFLVSIIVYSLVLYVLNDKFFINIIKKYFYKIKRRFL